jgi:hypothetical protein
VEHGTDGHEIRKIVFEQGLYSDRVLLSSLDYRSCRNVYRGNSLENCRAGYYHAGCGYQHGRGGYTVRQTRLQNRGARAR